jgi:iron-sulfur cluster repair protein YtfE (RIC family)
MFEEELLHELVLRYPDLMPVLDRLEIDLPNAGTRTLVEAALAHGLEPGPVMAEALRAIKRERQ